MDDCTTTNAVHGHKIDSRKHVQAGEFYANHSRTSHNHEIICFPGQGSTSTHSAMSHGTLEAIHGSYYSYIHIQYGAGITWSIFSQMTPQSSPVRAKYGVSYVNPACDWYFASVPVIGTLNNTHNLWWSNQGPSISLSTRYKTSFQTMEN